MKIIEILNKKPTFSLEIFPPKSENVIDTSRELIKQLSKISPDFISTTYGAAGSTQRNTQAIAGMIEQEYKISALSHFTCVGSSKETIDSVLLELKSFGVENVLALRGDLPKDLEKTDSYFKHANELAQYIKKNYDFCVGGACYPEKHPESKTLDEDIDNLKRKVDCGVDFLTTQLFFDNDIFYRFLDKIKAKEITVPIVAGIMPITSAKQIKRICELSGNEVPHKLTKIVDKFGGNDKAMEIAGIVYLLEQAIELLSSGINHIHLYTMNKPDIAIKISSVISDVMNRS